MKPLAPLFLLLLSACGGSLAPVTPPPQPTPPYLQIANAQLETLVHSDGTPLSGVEVWHVGDYAVTAACHTYLNGAATKQTDLALGGMGAGLLGAGLSMVNPLAGVASSLVQTLITAYSNTGPVPTTADAILITNSMHAYETGVDAAPPIDRATAVSRVDDLWFACSPGGAAITELQAKTSAQMGVSVNGQFLLPRAASAGRPVVIVNPSSAPMPAQMNVTTSPPDIMQDTQETTITPSRRPRLEQQPATAMADPASFTTQDMPQSLQESIVRHRQRSHRSLLPTASTQAGPIDLTDPDKPARLQWLRETSTYIHALDDPRPSREPPLSYDEIQSLLAKIARGH